MRQGNENEKVKIFRYITENTFDSYSWQLIENKQKFIGQIMTSKSPVRSCEDVDEAALTYAEVKALATGNPHIKEKMELDIQVSKLKLLKSEYTNQHYRLEDILQRFPEEIKEAEDFISGIQADIQTLSQHPHPVDGFAGMEIQGTFYTDKAEAGAALLAICQDISSTEPVTIGSYRGFGLLVKFSGFSHKLILTGVVSYKLDLGTDVFGNLTRVENALAKIPENLERWQTKLSNLLQQQEAAKLESNKPFPQEEELRIKSARLAKLDSELNLGGRAQETA